MENYMARKKYDFYETPTDMTEDLLNFYRYSIFSKFFYRHSVFSKFFDKHLSIFEPCVGDGAILRPLTRMYENGDETLNFITNDLIVNKGIYSRDMTEEESWQSIKEFEGNIDLTITNPPFSDAFEILQLAYNYSQVGVIMLLRLSFLEPTSKRKEWLEQHPPNFLRVYGSPRPRFREKGTDFCTTAWMGWFKSPAILTSLMLRNPISFAHGWNK